MGDRPAMRPIVTTLVVYVIAAASVFGLQLLAVTAFLTWRSGGLDLERDGLATLLVGVPASSGALIAIAILAAGRPRGASACGSRRVACLRARSWRWSSGRSP